MTKNEQWDGPELPLELDRQCIVKVDEDSILLTGGRTLDSKKYMLSNFILALHLPFLKRPKFL